MVGTTVLSGVHKCVLSVFHLPHFCLPCCPLGCKHPKVLIYFHFTLLTQSFVSTGCLNDFLFCFHQIKGAWCEKNYSERQKGMNFPQSLSCCCYTVPFSQLLSKDTRFSPWNGYHPGYCVFHSRLHQ